MAIDEYDFTNPGAIPFQWEIRPGVPKLQHQKQPPPPQACDYSFRPLSPLKPPPAGSVFVIPAEPRTRSFRSGLPATRTKSERWRFEQPNFLARRPEIVGATGCFLSPLLERKISWKKGKSGSARMLLKPEPKSEPDCSSDLETLSRWSVSSRKSLLSPFRDSPTSMSSYLSYQSSPRPVSDAEWAGFGLFQQVCMA